MKPLTSPMKITLIDCANRGSRTPSRSLYPAGQARFIAQGLADRDLLDPDTGQLTDEGARRGAELVGMINAQPDGWVDALHGPDPSAREDR